MKNVIESIIIGALLFLFLSFMGGFYVGARYTDNQIGVDTLQRKVDSLFQINENLREENFELSLESGRWEVAVEWFKEVKPREARLLENWRLKNTE